MSEEIRICQPCKGLIGRGRHTPPHSHLVKVGKPREFHSAMGNADEQDYVCQQCDTKWTHEYGNCGTGWFTREDD